MTVTIPSATATGIYFLIAKADDDQRVLETSETNNTRSTLLTIGPDLVVSTLTVPASAAPGSTIAVADTVKNQGAGSAGASLLRFYLSANASFDAGDVVAHRLARRLSAAGRLNDRRFDDGDDSGARLRRAATT